MKKLMQFKRKLKLTINNQTVDDNQTIANEFNNFFVSIGPALADNITCFVDPMSYVDNIMNSIVQYFICLLYGYQDHNFIIEK